MTDNTEKKLELLMNVVDRKNEEACQELITNFKNELWQAVQPEIWELNSKYIDVKFSGRFLLKFLSNHPAYAVSYRFELPPGIYKTLSGNKAALMCARIDLRETKILKQPIRKHRRRNDAR